MPRTKNSEQVETPSVDDTKLKKVKKDKKHKKDKKRNKEGVESAPVAVVATQAAPVPEAAVVAQPSSKSSKEKTKKVKSKTPTKVEVSVKENTETPSEDEDEDEVGVIDEKVSGETAEDGSEECDDQFNENREKTDELLKSLISVVQDRIASDKNLLSSLRELNRQVTRERKEVGKIVKKLNKGQRKKRRGGNKSPGGFTKPAPLSAQMCAFLEVTDGTELPRTEVTRRVNAYVKTNDLQNPENKKQILADGKLKSLLYLKDDDELTYFNLQRFMKVHFLKRDDTGAVCAFVAPVATTPVVV
jgi:chromatin remodeling complex protein RSC6